MKSYRNKLKLTKLLQAICRLLPAMLVCGALISSTTAQQGGTTSYVYDDNGRLHAVISPSGESFMNMTRRATLPPFTASQQLLSRSSIFHRTKDCRAIRSTSSALVLGQ